MAGKRTRIGGMDTVPEPSPCDRARPLVRHGVAGTPTEGKIAIR